MDIPLVEQPDHLKPPPPPTLEDAEPQPASKRPSNWWSILGLSGSRESVGKAIADDHELIEGPMPDHWKAAIQSEINALESKYNFVRVDAHHQTEKGHVIISLSITPSAVL